MKFIGICQDDYDEPMGAIYDSKYGGYKAWFNDTFTAPYTWVFPLKVTGKTYAERKASLVEFAMDWQRTFTDFGIDWSYGEFVTVYDFLERNARRYGLIREFRENGIC